MSNILSVGVLSSFSGQAVDAAGSAQEELDPRFVEELQGAMGQQEAEQLAPTATGEQTSPVPDDAVEEAAVSLQNLPLMPWISMALPANFAPQSPALKGSTGESGGVEGVTGVGVMGLTPSMDDVASAELSHEASTGGGATVEGSVSLRAVPNLMGVDTVPAGAMPTAGQESSAREVAAGPAPVPVVMASDHEQHLASAVANASDAPRADTRPSESGQTSATVAVVVAPQTPEPIVGTVTISQASAAGQATLQSAMNSVAMAREPRKVDGTLHAQEAGSDLAEAQPLVTGPLAQGSHQHLAVETRIGASAQVASDAVVASMPTDGSVSLTVGAKAASHPQTSMPADPGDGAVDAASTIQQMSNAPGGADRVTTAESPAAGITELRASDMAPTERQAPSGSISPQALAASPSASTIEVAATAVGHPSGYSGRGVSNRNEMSRAIGPLNAGGVDHMGATSPDTSVSTIDAAFRVASQTPSPTEQDAATSTLESSVSAAVQLRPDAAVALGQHDSHAPVSGLPTDVSLAKAVPTLSPSAWGAGMAETVSQDVSAAESTFASSFVQALMGQVHHATGQHAQPLEVVPTPEPMAPHQVRFDAGQVQVEVVRLVKQGGGQVVMELTPPDESKFKIDLTISQQGVARLVVDGASESTRSRLEQTVSGLQDQFQQMGLQLQLDMRQPHQQEARSQAEATPWDGGQPSPRVSRPVAEIPQPVTGRPAWEQGQVYLVA